MRRTKYKKRDPLLPPKTGAFATVDEHTGARREPVYNAKYHPKIVFRLSLLNLSESEMCVPLDISIDCFQKWKQRHPEFRIALHAGREKADAHVARALYRRAVGWGVLEENTIVRKVKDADGGEHLEQMTVQQRRKLPPDVQAIQMWLRNRQPNKWKIGDAAPQNAMHVNFDFSTLSLEDLKMAQRLGFAQQQANKELEEYNGNGNGNGNHNGHFLNE